MEYRDKYPISEYSDTYAIPRYSDTTDQNRSPAPLLLTKEQFVEDLVR